jgi:hypothetical protein
MKLPMSAEHGDGAGAGNGAEHRVCRLIERCWLEDMTQRPTISEVVRELQSIVLSLQ